MRTLILAGGLRAGSSLVDARYHAEAVTKREPAADTAPMADEAAVPYAEDTAQTDQTTGVTMVNAPNANASAAAVAVRAAPVDPRARQGGGYGSQIDPYVWYELPDEDDFATVDEANYAFMHDSEELYTALDSSRFPQRLLVASVRVETL
jgi:hypothetical protein